MDDCRVSYPEDTFAMESSLEGWGWGVVRALVAERSVRLWEDGTEEGVERGRKGRVGGGWAGVRVDTVINLNRVSVHDPSGLNYFMSHSLQSPFKVLRSLGPLVTLRV